MNREASSPLDPIRRHPVRTAAAAIAGVLILGSLWFWLTLPDVSGLARGWPDTTAYMELRIRQARAEGRTLDLRYRPVSQERIPDHLEETVRVAEDAGFYGHRGVDWYEVRTALAEAWEERTFPRGASTITQQLARNLYLSPSQTPWRKLREFFIARRLEEELSKRRILELYLNVIELGPGTFGVDAAARRYFGVPVDALTRSQAEALAATIPGPRTHNPATATAQYRWRVRLIGRRMAVMDSLRRAGAGTVSPADLPTELAADSPVRLPDRAPPLPGGHDTVPLETPEEEEDTASDPDTLPEADTLPRPDTAGGRDTAVSRLRPPSR